MRRYILAVACVSLALAPTGSAQELKTLEHVMAFVKQSGTNTNTWSADSEMNLSMQGNTMKMKGTTSGKGARTYSSMSMEAMGQRMNMKTIVDPDGIQWTIMNMLGQEQITKSDPVAMNKLGSTASALPMPGAGGPTGMSQNPFLMLESYTELYDFEFAGTDLIHDREVYVLKGDMKKELFDAGMLPEVKSQLDGMMGKIIVMIDAKDGFVRSFEQTGIDDFPFMLLEFSNVTLNEPIDDGLFEYTPPDSANVNDMTELLRKQMEQMEKPPSTN